MRRRLLLVALAFAAAPLAAELSASHARLLAASDPFARAPEQLRLELEVRRGAAGTSPEVALEIWRRGEELSLVRFLAERERGKYVLRRGADVFLLTPGARDPVRLSAALAPAGGAALDQLLGLRLSRDFRPVAASEESGVVTFDLEANRPEVAPARVRWVVSRASGLPLRAEFRDAGGRVLRLVEFKSWRDAAGRVPEEIAAKDIGQVGDPLSVRIRAFEPRPVPEAIFELDGAAARAALPPPG